MPYKDPVKAKAAAREASARYYQRNKEANIARLNDWHARNPELSKEIRRRSRLKNRDKYNARKREFMRQPTEREKARRRSLARKFGITLEQYDSMLDTQNGVCAICKRPETSLHLRSPDPDQHGPQLLAVDHDHVSGRIRGLLCKSCNVAIGAFGEDLDRLRGAIAYLETHRQVAE